jgi:hypothetical protein
MVFDFVLLAICIPRGQAKADTYLQLLTTIPILRDSTRVTSITPIGDFNADGWGDMAIGLITSFGFSRSFNALEIYYGGPAFDSIPDIYLTGDLQNMQICGVPNAQATSFGEVVTPLTDFNGDGFNDFAVSACAQCTHDYHNGRIYIYFGGPNADTIPDVKIDGDRGWDFLGRMLGSGDFNGDGFSDLMVSNGDQYYNGESVNIYFGSNPPDSTLDWIRAYPRGDTTIYSIGAGYDPNDDGYDDFSWTTQGELNFYWGGDSLGHQPVSYINTGYNFLNIDLSGDGVDDFMRFTNGSRRYLCLGGAPFDTVPDYPEFTWMWYPFIFHSLGHEDKLVLNNVAGQCLVVYDIAVPPDTIPIAYLPYYFQTLSASPDIGDINGDGTTEIALGDNNSQGEHINIYTITTTGIDGDNNILPLQPGIFSAYPNPFNSATTLTITGMAKAEIAIFDITGRLISSLNAENGRAIWDASAFPSGLYLARVVGKNKIQTIKLILLK